MEYRKVGSSGLVVSEIALGSWITFGTQVELDLAGELLKTAFDLGINYIDTADMYHGGRAEELLGEILPRYNRRHYVLATKAFWPMSENPTDRGLSRKHIVDSVLMSLERLKHSYVDIFYCHRYDPETPLAETLHAIEDLIRLGKIVYWGTSDWEADQIAEAYALCEERRWHPPIVNQPIFSLVERRIEYRILPVAARLGMGTVCYSPLAQGVLTGKYSKGKVPEGSRGSDESLNTWMRGYLSDNDLLERVDRLKEIGRGYGLSIPQVSLAWILQVPGITGVIAGATKPGQLEENVQASGVKLSREDMEHINILFPGITGS